MSRRSLSIHSNITDVILGLFAPTRRAVDERLGAANDCDLTVAEGMQMFEREMAAYLVIDDRKSVVLVSSSGSSTFSNAVNTGIRLKV